MKKIFVIAVFLILIVLFFVLYRRVKLFTNISVPSQKQKVSVFLDWFPNTNHTGLYVAKEKGYFDKEGLDVSITQPSEGENTQVVAVGKIDFAISSQEAVTLARASDIPVVSIGTIIQHNTSAFASLAQSNIKKVNDFEGKRYGGWGSPIEEATLQALMKEAGADYGKLKNITIGETDFFKTIGRDSDIQWIFYGWDGIEAKRRGIALNTIMLKELNPILDYYTPVIITNEAHVKNKKELVEKFMRAVLRGYEFAVANPDESAQILLKHVPELNADLVLQSQVYLSQQYTSDALGWGIQKEEVWNRYAQWLFDHKLLKKTIIAKDAFTNEFLP